MTDRPDRNDDLPVIEVRVEAPPDAVWRALRDPDLLRRWHGWHFDGLDEEIRVIYAQPDEVDDEQHVLVVQGGDRFLLTPDSGGTVVTVTRAPHGTDPEWDAYYDDVTEGWTTFLQQLRFGLERHGLADRRTLFLSGDLEGAGPLAALGLDDVADLPVGARWAADVAPGDALTGTVWHRSDHQLFLTVDQVGDGLLVLAGTPVTSYRPRPGGMVLLTGYGLDDADAADLERRWTAWWDAVRTPEQPVTG
ncbi:SRPBCC family protein [Thalassiella azotivora]